jgi:predicted kinase
MVCGKIASGKSTLAADLGRSAGAVVIAEDAWLHALYADQLASLGDYGRCSGRLRAAMAPHVAALLGAGVSVVLDFPANTVDQRAWMRGIVEASGAAHRLHLLAASDALCLARLRARNAAGDHPFAVTEDQFHQVTRHFAPPAPEEGFTIVAHAADG